MKGYVAPIFLSATLLLAVAGCSGGSTSQSPAAPNVSTKTNANGTEMHAEGFTITLPKDWTVINPSVGDTQKIMDEAFKDKADAATKAQVSMMVQNKMFKLFAFAPTTENGFRDNLNVNVVPGPGVTADKLFDASKAEMEKVAKVKESAKNGDTITFTSEFSAGTAKYTVFSYQQIHGDNIYTFSFSSGPGHEDKIKSMADEAFKTVKYD